MVCLKEVQNCFGIALKKRQFNPTIYATINNIILHKLYTVGISINEHFTPKLQLPIAYFPNTLLNKDLTLGTNRQSCGEHHRSISLGNPRQQTPSKFTLDNLKEDFLAKEWNSFHLFGMILDYLHIKDFLKYNCELYFKQPLVPP